MKIEFIVYAGIALAIAVGIAAEISGRRKRKQKNTTGKAS